jgi:LPS O-antigen subunit length determinant protein (WzzB/FepE family)
MKTKYSKHYNDEIDLSKLFKILWDKKKEIALIALITFVIIISYDKYKPKKPVQFNNSLIINPTKENEFLSFITIYNYINKSKSEENFIIKELKNKKILDRFIEEFLDFDELITVLKENDNVKKKIFQLSKYDRQQKLYEYAKLFNIEQSSSETPYYILKFTWPTDDREIRDIIDQTFKLTVKNLRESIFSELESYYNLEKNLIINKDLERIEYLTEQSKIAKEQGIAEKKNQSSRSTDQTSTKLENQSNIVDGLTFNINSNNVSYSADYLRGYKAINIEIDLIKNRKYITLESIRAEIDLLKKKDVRWIDYNIFLLETKIQNKNKTLSLSSLILSSLIIGVLYAFISNAFQFYKAPRKK